VTKKVRYIALEVTKKNGQDPNANTYVRGKKNKTKQPVKKWKRKQKQKKDLDRTLLITRLDADKTMLIRLDENLGVAKILPLYY